MNPSEKFTMAPYLFLDARLSPVARAVYLHLVNVREPTGIHAIGKAVRFSPRPVKAALAELEAGGWVTLEDGPRRGLIAHVVDRWEENFNAYARPGAAPKSRSHFVKVPQLFQYELPPGPLSLLLRFLQLRGRYESIRQTADRAGLPVGSACRYRDALLRSRIIAPAQDRRGRRVWEVADPTVMLDMVSVEHFEAKTTHGGESAKPLDIVPVEHFEPKQPRRHSPCGTKPPDIVPVEHDMVSVEHDMVSVEHDMVSVEQPIDSVDVVEERERGARAHEESSDSGLPAPPWSKALEIYRTQYWTACNRHGLRAGRPNVRAMREILEALFSEEPAEAATAAMRDWFEKPDAETVKRSFSPGCFEFHALKWLDRRDREAEAQRLQAQRRQRAEAEAQRRQEAQASDPLAAVAQAWAAATGSAPEGLELATLRELVRREDPKDQSQAGRISREIAQAYGSIRKAAAAAEGLPGPLKVWATRKAAPQRPPVQAPRKPAPIGGLAPLIASWHGELEKIEQTAAAAAPAGRG